MNSKILTLFFLITTVFFLALLLDAYYCYPYSELSWISFLGFFLIPVTGIVLSVAAFFFSVRVQTILAVNLIAGSLVVCLVLFVGEIYLNQKRKDLGEDPREEESILDRTSTLRESGREIYPVYTLSTLIEYMKLFGKVRSSPVTSKNSPIEVAGKKFIPLTGAINSSVVLCREHEDWIEIQTDEMGFHNPPGVWSATPELALVGDSYVQGFCLPKEQSLVSRVRESLPSVIGVGTGGAGPLLELGLIREYLSRIKPKHVFWVYYENDLEGLEEEKEFTVLRNYLEPEFSQSLVENKNEISKSLKKWLIELLDVHRSDFEREVLNEQQPGGLFLRKKFKVLKVDNIRALASRLHTHLISDYDLFEKVLVTAKSEVEAWGGELHFVYLPSWAHFNDSVKILNYYRLKNRREVLKIVKKLELPLVDMLDVFSAQEEPQSCFYGLGKHYSPKGYELTAKSITDSLQ